MSFLPACFQRRFGLGVYSGTKAEWIEAYRIARHRKRTGKDATVHSGGLLWKAQLIVFFGRDRTDELLIPLRNRVWLKNNIREILEEANNY